MNYNSRPNQLNPCLIGGGTAGVYLWIFGPGLSFIDLFRYFALLFISLVLISLLIFACFRKVLSYKVSLNSNKNYCLFMYNVLPLLIHILFSFYISSHIRDIFVK